MRGRALAGIAALAVLLGTACSGGSSASVDSFGGCPIRPGVVCRDQDLRHTSVVAANLQGADLSGSNLEGADLRDADLRGAKLVGANLAGVSFMGANLAGADLTDAQLYITNFSRANLEGAVMTAADKQCGVIDPDGRFVEGEACKETFTAPTTQPGSSAPTRLEYFRAVEPAVCLNDLSGTGIEVEWKTANALGTTFLVDGIRVGGSKKARGRARLPFVCDGAPHEVEMQAFGAQSPLISKSFSLELSAGSRDSNRR